MSTKIWGKVCFNLPPRMDYTVIMNNSNANPQPKERNIALVLSHYNRLQLFTFPVGLAIKPCSEIDNQHVSKYRKKGQKKDYP